MKKWLLTVLILGMMINISYAGASDAPRWAPRYEDSRITFISTENAMKFEGAFENFTAEIAFDPDNLEESHVKAIIDITSVTRYMEDRDKTLRSPDWFDVETYKTAAFEAENFEQTGDNSYIAHGTLTIKNISRPFDLPFTLEIDGQTAVMNSDFQLLRLDYNVGINDWAETSFVANEVRLNIHLVADKK